VCPLAVRHRLDPLTRVLDHEKANILVILEITWRGALLDGHPRQSLYHGRGIRGYQDSCPARHKDEARTQKARRHVGRHALGPGEQAKFSTNWPGTRPSLADAGGRLDQ
jgi:hypothetical protein